MSPLLQLPIHFVSWLTVKVRVWVAMLRTDQTVGSSVTNARVVTVSGVTWIILDLFPVFPCFRVCAQNPHQR